jgi:hypothetical protein
VLVGISRSSSALGRLLTKDLSFTNFAMAELSVGIMETQRPFEDVLNNVVVEGTESVVLARAWESILDEDRE